MWGWGGKLTSSTCNEDGTQMYKTENPLSSGSVADVAERYVMVGWQGGGVF